MRARVPLDVDLEDRLIYGLSPLHFGQLVMSALAAFWVGRSGLLPGVKTGLVALLLLVGVLLAWGRWRGRPLESWSIDLGRYLVSNYRIELSARLVAAARRSSRFPKALGRGLAGVPAGLRHLRRSGRDGRRPR